VGQKATAGEGTAAGSWVFLALTGILALLFYRAFVFHPARMLYGTDMIGQAYQLRDFALRELHSGHGFPLWNPYVFGGIPYMEILPGPVFYPTTLLYLVLPLYRAIGWTFVLHTFLGGAFAYFAARSLRLGRWAAAVSGLAYMFAGIVVSTLYGGHDGRMFAMVLMPLAFGFLERGVSTGRAGYFLALGLTVAAQIYTPQIQIMYFSSLALSAYGIFRIVERARARERGRVLALRLGGGILLAFGLAALIGAAQLLPTYQLLSVGVRGGTGEAGYAFASSWAMPPQELSALLLPDLMGSLATYWGSNPGKLHTEFIGAVAPALALIALAGRRPARRTWFLAAATAICILFALGAATPVHRIAYAIVPMIRRFRAPSMMLAPASLFVALLAGIGWQSVLESRATGKRLAWGRIGLIGGSLLLLPLAAALSPRGLLSWAYHSWFPTGWPRVPPTGLEGSLRVNGWLALAGACGALTVAYLVATRRVAVHALLIVLGLLVLELWRVDARYLETVTPEEAFASDSAIAYMQAHLEPGERVFPLPGSYGSNELMQFGVPALTGNQNFRLRWMEELVGGLSNANLNHPALWDLLDLRFVSSGQALRSRLIRLEATAPRARVYGVVRRTPHAFFPRRVEVVEDSAVALRRVLAFEDGRQVAVVTRSDARAAGLKIRGSALQAGEGRAEIESYAPNEVRLRVEAVAGGLLFISEPFYRRWRATLDGRPVAIVRTDVALRGVMIPQGSHELRFRYDPGGVRTGIWIAGISLLLTLLALAVLGWRRLTARRKERPAE